MFSQACQSAVLIFMLPQSFHMIVCAAYIIADISKPRRMSKLAHLENYFDKP